MKAKEQIDLFGAPPPTPKEWQAEWQGMPEFVQQKQEAYATLTVRFDSEEDLQEFAALIGQKLTQRTKSIWHPHRPHCGGPNSGKRWVDAR